MVVAIMRILLFSFLPTPKVSRFVRLVLTDTHIFVERTASLKNGKSFSVGVRHFARLGRRVFDDCESNRATKSRSSLVANQF